MGKGKRLLWPTKFPERDEDTIAVAELTSEHTNVEAIVCEGYGWFSAQGSPWGAPKDVRFAEQKIPPLEWIKENLADCEATIVDCHA